MPPPTLHPAKDVAVSFDMSVQWLLTLTYRHNWPHRRVGRQVKYSDDDLRIIVDALAGEPPARKGRPRRGVA